MSIFGNAKKNRDTVNVTEVAHLNAILAHLDPSEVPPLAIRAQDAWLVATSLAEQASVGTGSLTTVAPAGPSGVDGSGGASGSEGGEGSIDAGVFC